MSYKILKKEQKFDKNGEVIKTVLEVLLEVDNIRKIVVTMDINGNKVLSIREEMGQEEFGAIKAVSVFVVGFNDFVISDWNSIFIELSKIIQEYKYGK